MPIPTQLLVESFDLRRLRDDTVETYFARWWRRIESGSALVLNHPRLADAAAEVLADHVVQGIDTILPKLDWKRGDWKQFALSNQVRLLLESQRFSNKSNFECSQWQTAYEMLNDREYIRQKAIAKQTTSLTSELQACIRQAPEAT